MKRYGDLFERVVAFDSLLAAFRRAYRGCSHAAEAKRFNFRLEPELLALRDELAHGTYRPGGFRQFHIRDPKPRVISVAPFRDRVVHHAVVGVLEPIYERSFIHDSYATRKNRGTHAAILRVQRFLRACEWYARADIEHFFETVDHDVLLGLLARKLKDRRLMALLEHIVCGIRGPRGLPIGNLTSQFLANVYLDPLDHYLKERVGVHRYVRYMDDIVMLSGDKDKLLRAIAEMRVFVEGRLRLRLKERAVFVNQRANGISFLGARVFPRHIRMRPANLHRSLRRFEVKKTRFEKSLLDETVVTAGATSVYAHLAFFNTHRLRTELGRATPFWR